MCFILNPPCYFFIRVHHVHALSCLKNRIFFIYLFPFFLIINIVKKVTLIIAIRYYITCCKVQSMCKDMTASMKCPIL